MSERLVLRFGDREYQVELQGQTVVIDGVGTRAHPGAVALADGDRRWVFVDGDVYEFTVQREGRRRSAAHQGSLTAPMPATVTRINVVAGARVKKGDTLVVLEAMKMELPVRAPADGTVRAVTCREGELVQPGVPLVELEA